MPHLVILYSGNLGQVVDMNATCRLLADTMLSMKDEEGRQVFPTGGTRVLAYPAPYFAIADGGVAGLAVDGSSDYAFAYLNLRMGRGRSETTKKRIGDALVSAVRAQFETLLASKRVGLTLQIDEGPEVFDAKVGNLHALFQKS